MEIKVSNTIYIFSSKKNLYDKSNIIYYVGKSNNSLKCRIFESFYKRFNNKFEKVYLHVMDYLSDVDISILEIYFINKFRSRYNKTSKYNIESSILKIDEMSYKTVQFIRYKHSKPLNPKDKTEAPISTIKNDIGIYIFNNNINFKDEVDYIGISITNLKERIIKSKNVNSKNSKNIHILKMDNPTDIEILEIYLINTLKPLHNKMFLYEDSSSSLLIDYPTPNLIK